MARRVILHAGQHKTGSTSIQRYLWANRSFFRTQGIAVCGDWTPQLTRPAANQNICTAKTVANAIIRNGLQTPVRLSGTRPALEPKHRRQGLRRVNDHLRGLPEETALLSAEALSFARAPGELHRIAMLCDGMDWRAVMFLREPAAWLASWQTQVSLGLWAKRPDAVMGSGVLDLGPESWLVDHDAIRAFWGNRCAFLDYEGTMAKHGSVIPAFLAEIGLDPGVCPDWGDYYLNSSAVKRAFAAGLR